MTLRHEMLSQHWTNVYQCAAMVDPTLYNKMIGILVVFPYRNIGTDFQRKTEILSPRGNIFVKNKKAKNLLRNCMAS